MAIKHIQKIRECYGTICSKEKENERPKYPPNEPSSNQIVKTDISKLELLRSRIDDILAKKPQSEQTLVKQNAQTISAISKYESLFTQLLDVMKT